MPLSMLHAGRPQPALGLSGLTERVVSSLTPRHPTETGMKRLALSSDDQRVRDWLKSELRSLGCDVKVDQMGNMFGVRPGAEAGVPIGMGSHLDTQPTGETAIHAAARQTTVV